MDAESNAAAYTAKAAQINARLKAGGYKPAEARAVVIEHRRHGARIALYGKKADGFVTFSDGQWHAEKISFTLLHRLVSEAL